MKPRYAYLTSYSTSRAMRRILRGHLRSRVCDPTYLDASPAAALARDMGPHEDPKVLIRWTVDHRMNERGCHILRQPVIVGVILPHADGEPLRWMRWGARAKEILMAAVMP